jgi:hypothetical protein
MTAGIRIPAPMRSSFRIRWMNERFSGLFSRWMCRYSWMMTTEIAPMGRLWIHVSEGEDIQEYVYLLDIKTPSP